jgi:DNA (cytosine-5)-methyltransferase 1
MKNLNIKAIDLFCGIGGITQGLIQAGINVIAGIDTDESCKYAYEVNNKGSKFYNIDIKELNEIDLEKMYGGSEIRILVGCAPCQPFSKHTQKNKNRDQDKKWGLLGQFGRIVSTLQPEIVSMENVPQLRNSRIYQEFLEVLNDNYYKISSKVVYCPDYGIPQTRSRLVLLASRLGSIELLPTTIKKNEYKTVMNTIGNLEPLENGQASTSDPLHRASKLSPINLKRMKQSKPGGTWRDWEDTLQLECHQKKSGKTYPSVYGRMRWDKPSPTITTQFYNFGTGRFGHPEQNRAISLREGALLQTFPPNYQFFDNNSNEIYVNKLGKHIGNAVPPKLGYIIGSTINNHLEEYYEGR